ncbi:LysR family transcriptional regulator [Phyllobacterium sp. 1468]
MRRTADNLAISPSAVSQMLRTLEDRFGAKLLRCCLRFSFQARRL